MSALIRNSKFVNGGKAMDGKKKEGKTKRGPNYKVLSIIFSDLLLLAIFQLIFYFFNDREALIPIYITGVAIIILASILGLCIWGIIGESKKTNNAYYNNEMKALRAIYLMMKKNHGIVESTQKETEDAINKISREIVLNQKASSKVVVSRNKENTDALMNSNDIIIDKLLKLMAEIKENQNVSAEQNQRMSAIAESLSGQVETVNKEDIEKIMEKLNSLSSSISTGALSPANEVPVEEIPEMNIGDTEISEMNIEDTEIPEIDFGDMSMGTENEEELPNVDDMFDISDLDLSGFEEDNGDVVLTGLDELMSEEVEENDEAVFEDMSELDDLLASLETPVEEEAISEDAPVMTEEEPDLDDLLASLETPVEEPVSEETDDTVEDIDLDDLLASLDTPVMEEASESVVEEEPAPPEPVVEETPLPEMNATPVSMGDMDSNEKLTPEQIAELFASMGN